MSKREPTAIGDVLGALEKTPELKRIFDQATVVSAWEEIVGEKLATRGKPHSMKDGRLKIEAENSVWAHKFLYHKRRIKTRINNMLGKRYVKEIFVVLQGEESAEPEPAADEI